MYFWVVVWSCMYTTMSLTVVGVDEGGNQPVQRRNCDSEGLGFNYGTLQHCVACYVCCYMTLAHVVHCGALRCVAASQSVM